MDDNWLMKSTNVRSRLTVYFNLTDELLTISTIVSATQAIVLTMVVFTENALGAGRAMR